jgi:hypothetical protein
LPKNNIAMNKGTQKLRKIVQLARKIREAAGATKERSGKKKYKMKWTAAIKKASRELK